MSSKVLTVAWREFKQTVMRPVFVIAVLGIPILIVGIAVVAGVILINHKEPALIGRIAIVESGNAVTTAAAEEFSEEKIQSDEAKEQQEQAERVLEGQFQAPAGPGAAQIPGQRGEVRVTFERIALEKSDDSSDSSDLDPSPEIIDSLKSRVQDGDLIAFAVVKDDVLAMPDPTVAKRDRTRFDLFVADGIDSDNVRLMERRMGLAVVRARAEMANYEPEAIMALLEQPNAETRTIDETGQLVKSNEGMRELKAQILPMAFMMLIWIGVFSSAQHLMMSTIEEKSNKVMEVLLSAISPLQLMTGKIVGYGLVGLLIVGIYSSLAVAGLIALATFSNWIHWTDLLMLGVMYIMAYGMISCMLAAVGSAVSDVREANTLVTPVMMILMVPLMLWMPITQSPNGVVATVCSFVPPATPFAMILRHVAEEPVPAWQYPATIIWGFICVLGMVWFASRVFRVGVLMTGKPPSIMELIKWARYA